MWVMKDEFDLARYPKSSPFSDTTKNKVVGKWKYDASGKSITEFEGLKPKMHSYQTLRDPSHDEAGFTTKKRAKGIIRAAVAKQRHAQYNAQQENPEENYVPNRRIGSKFHQIYGIEVWS